MKNLNMLWLLLLAGYAIGASCYDYSTSIECLEHPLAPQYEGGLVSNPSFDNGLSGWNAYGEAQIELRKSSTGNQFLVASNRTQPRDSFFQQLHLEQGLYYTFSVWVRMDQGNDTIVAARLGNSRDNETTHVGSVIAQPHCWSMLKGGFTVDANQTMHLFFESNNTNAELWVDSLSLQAFTKQQWKEHQLESIEKVRKRNLRIRVSDKEGNNMTDVKITIQSIKPGFRLGCAMADPIIQNQQYQQWFASRFTVTTFENEMKWYSTERSQWQENYATADAMMYFAKQHGIAVRGHNIFWDDPKMNMDWVKALNPTQLYAACMRRIYSLVKRYAGQVIHWDVVNENMHFSFFETMLGPSISGWFYRTAQNLDPRAVMFLNEYNTLEEPHDPRVTPWKYISRIRQIQSYPGSGGMTIGIGLEGHFGTPNLPYIRSSLDTLAATKMPIWITELDVKPSPNQAVYLEQVMRETFSHPAVQGIVLWSGWKPSGCNIMCLTDNNFRNLPTGYVVDKLIREWNTHSVFGTTDESGSSEHRVFHGSYLVTVVNQLTGENSTQTVEVTGPNSEPMDLHIRL